MFQISNEMLKILTAFKFCPKCSRIRPVAREFDRNIWDFDRQVRGFDRIVRDLDKMFERDWNKMFEEADRNLRGIGTKSSRIYLNLWGFRANFFWTLYGNARKIILARKSGSILKLKWWGFWPKIFRDLCQIPEIRTDNL